jgi:hypothetical protein
MINGLGENSIRNFKTQILFDGRVVSLKDDYNTGQIKVRLDIDGNIPDEELPIALPLLPKYLNIYPKINERVTVLVTAISNGNQSSNSATRFWIGPWIPQPQVLKGSDYTSSFSDLPTGYIALDTSIDAKADATGIYPSKEFISIQGRNNTDITLKNKEVILRAGKFIPNKPTQFNGKDPSYIQLRYLTTEDLDVTPDSNTIGSNINVVSNYINLLSHRGNTSSKFVLTNRTDMITNKDQSYINMNTHPIPFGDILVDFLQLIKNFASTHIHPYHAMVSDPEENLNNLLNFDLNSILNNNVRTN